MKKNPRRGGVARALLIWSAVAAAAALGGPKILRAFRKPAAREEVAQERVEPRPVMRAPTVEERVEREPVLRLRTYTIQKNRFSDSKRESWIDYWKKMASANKTLAKRTKPLSETVLGQLAQRIESEYGVPHTILRAFIEQESGGNPNVIGGVLELGLTQIRPEKIVELQEMGYPAKNPLDPAENVSLFAFAFHDYIRSAQARQTNSGAVERLYEWNGTTMRFTQLPFETQLAIVARIHNGGVNGTYAGTANSNGIYSPQKILEGKNGNYAREILQRFRRMQRE